MASLGQLTAGIAHEIKNPLNFVNNFSDLSGESAGRVERGIGPGKIDVPEETRAEIDGITTTLKGNLGKIAHHGRRADSIVKNMLLHSRSGGGEHREVDFNATVEEALNLAYHGARAENPGVQHYHRARLRSGCRDRGRLPPGVHPRAAKPDSATGSMPRINAQTPRDSSR